MPDPSGKKPRMPMGVSCLKADCSDNLHCFRATKDMVSEGRAGECRYCSAQLVDWPRVRGRDATDIEHTFLQMKYEWVRHYMWHVDIDERAVLHARRKGRDALGPFIEKTIRQKVGPEKPYRDGYQTPWRGQIVFYAQHATASCCRACIEEWHGISAGRQLTDAEVAYLAQLATRFVDERLPQLTRAGEKLPPPRKKPQ